jgi:hypothetical protein
MEVNNKIRTASVDQYCGAFLNFDWPEILTYSRKTCLKSPHLIQRSDWELWLLLYTWTVALFTLKSKSNLTWVVSQCWTVSFPSSSRRFALESWIGLVVNLVASCLSLQNSLIANTFLQRHCVEVVTDKNFK